MDIQTAISKPFADIKTLIIGVILSIIPIVNILTIPGYLLRVASNTMKGNKKLPEFNNFGELIVDSLKAIVTLIAHGFVYGIVATILALIPFIGPALALIWMIAFTFIIVAGILTLAKTKSIGAAINIPELLNKAKKADFIIAVIVAMVISMIIYGILIAIIAMVSGAAIIPILMTGQFDAIQMTELIGSLLGVGLVAMIISSILQFVLGVFSVTLTAEEYK